MSAWFFRLWILVSVSLTWLTVTALPSLGQTGTQSGVRGNPNCPPPVLPGGIIPKNWSCPTGNQSPFKKDDPDGSKGIVRKPPPKHPARVKPGEDEYDTADEPGGKAGGDTPGRNASSRELRCGDGESIVGLRVRRGEVLDGVQVACAKTSCSAGSCVWSAFQWGPNAGNLTGGRAFPPMVCSTNEVVSGFQARVVTFTQPDYVADIAVECVSSYGGTSGGSKSIIRHNQPTTQWLYTDRTLDHPAPRNAKANEIQDPVTCLPSGRARAVVADEADFGNRGQRVVQAISFLCPKSDTSAPFTDPIGGDLGKLVQGLDKCVRETSKITYYEPPELVEYRGRANYDRAKKSVLYNKKYLEAQTPMVQSFWLGDVLRGAYSEFGT